MTGMTIGEALKETRKNLGLSQTEMAYPILTKSYYSKIERGIHEINASDLIKILEMHDVDISEFLVKCGVKDNRIDKDQWMSKLRQAYYGQDLEQVKSLKGKIVEVKGSESLQKILEANAILAEFIISRKIDQIPNKKRDQIKALILEGEWNEDKLRLFSLSLSFWTDGEMKTLLSSFIKKYNNIENFPRSTQVLVSSIMVNYLSHMIRSSSQNVEFIGEIFNLLDRLPIEPANCFNKIMKNFYQAYLEQDKRKIQDILSFLSNNDMNKIAEVLKVSI